MVALAAALLISLVPTASADEAATGYRFATKAIEEMQAAADVAHEDHRKRLKKGWGPAPSCLEAHALDIDNRLILANRERIALAALMTNMDDVSYSADQVDRRVRTVAIARSQVQQTVEASGSCPLVRTPRQGRRNRAEQDEDLAAR